MEKQNEAVRLETLLKKVERLEIVRKEKPSREDLLAEIGRLSDAQKVADFNAKSLREKADQHSGIGRDSAGRELADMKDFFALKAELHYMWAKELLLRRSAEYVIHYGKTREKLNRDVEDGKVTNNEKETIGYFGLFTGNLSEFVRGVEDCMAKKQEILRISREDLTSGYAKGRRNTADKLQAERAVLKQFRNRGK